MQGGPLKGQEGGDLWKMDMEDVITYHIDEKEELVVHIKNIESKVWRDIKNQLLEWVVVVVELKPFED
jgi:hypothetical protein